MQKVITANHAVSHAVRLARVEVIAAYPITPQTSIVEELSEMCARESCYCQRGNRRLDSDSGS